MDVIERRRSVRKFSEAPIDRRDLEELVRAGVFAPSGHNSQNQRFLIVDDCDEVLRIGAIRYSFPFPSKLPEDEKRLRRPGGIIGNASALILVFADASLSAPLPSGEYFIWQTLDVQNCAASIQNILLLATAKGIGSCWISACEEMNHTRLLSGRTWRNALAAYDIPGTFRIQGIVMLGKPLRVDEEGYPAPLERMHGVQWAPVERKPIEHYLIRPSDTPRGAVPIPRGTRLQLRLISALITRSLRLIHWLDRRVHRMEHRLLERTARDGHGG